MITTLAEQIKTKKNPKKAAKEEKNRIPEPGIEPGYVESREKAKEIREPAAPARGWVIFDERPVCTQQRLS